MGNAQLQQYAQGGYTPRCGSPDAINPDKGATSTLLNAGGLWRDRYGPLLHRTSIVNFISGKGILQSHKMLFWIVNSS
jgi:hypothetical protein